MTTLGKAGAQSNPIEGECAHSNPGAADRPHAIGDSQTFSRGDRRLLRGFEAETRARRATAERESNRARLRSARDRILGHVSDLFLNARLVARSDLTPALAILRLRADDGELQAFEPGQFVQLGLPLGEIAPGGRLRLQKRSYSIASSARSLDEVELYVTRVDDGRFTPQLWRLRVGDRVWLDRQPRGIFTLGALPAHSRVAWIATGTGLAPYVSMLRTWPATQRWSRAVLIHGVRSPDELGYRSELLERASQDPAFVYVPVVSRPQARDAWSGLSGRVQVALDAPRFRELAGSELEPEHWHVFLCGNPDMVNDVRALLEPRGFRIDRAQAPGTLHFEKYW